MVSALHERFPLTASLVDNVPALQRTAHAQLLHVLITGETPEVTAPEELSMLAAATLESLGRSVKDVEPSETNPYLGSFTINTANTHTMRRIPAPGASNSTNFNYKKAQPKTVEGPLFFLDSFTSDERLNALYTFKNLNTTQLYRSADWSMGSQPLRTLLAHPSCDGEVIRRVTRKSYEPKTVTAVGLLLKHAGGPDAAACMFVSDTIDTGNMNGYASLFEVAVLGVKNLSDDSKLVLEQFVKDEAELFRVDTVKQFDVLIDLIGKAALVTA